MTEDLESATERVARLRHRYEELRRRLRRSLGVDDIARLDASIGRRRARIHHLNAQIEALEEERSKLEGEVVGCLHGAEALLNDLVDQLESLDGPAWSPTPIVGFTLLHIADGSIDDGDHRWSGAALSPTCPNGATGLPHAFGPCVDQACGVLAWKTLDRMSEVAGANLAAIAQVSMTGRVVEHTDGYRAAHGALTALVAFDGGRWFRTRDPGQIEAFATSPASTFATLAAPIPHDAMLYVEVDLFLGRHP